MAFIRHRGKTYSVVYKILDENGEEHTTSETFATQKEADKRKKEIEYKQSIGKFEVQKCATLKELIEEYVQIYGHDKWGVSTYSGNVALINNYILPTIGDTKLASINTHFMEKYYKDLLKMPAVKSTKNPDGTGTITESTVNEIHKVLRSCFRQAVKWDMMEKNPAVDATVPKQCLIDLKKDQEEIIEALGNEYQNYNLVMATTFGLPIGDSYLRTKMQDIIDELGLPDVVFHSLRHTSVTYKLKLSGGDIKAVQGDSGHAQADMVTEVYGHILDEDRRKNAELMENAFYNKENLNPQMKAQDEGNSTITVPDGVDAELLMKVLGNPEMAALLTSLAKTMKV